MELLVDIRKRLAGFQLDVKLSGGSEAIGLLGASGSGKSMTLRCIAGIVRPDEGRIVVNGRTVFDSKKGIDLKPRERGVGLLFQNYALFPHLTVRENIEFGSARSLRRSMERRQLSSSKDSTSRGLPRDIPLRSREDSSKESP